ncbi:MAG: hypothetical protein JKY10_11480, partial [Cohaesibacteraceae bacterium]|nr:hypothetical protein [Cohaesibacteraceae bacterium]
FGIFIMVHLEAKKLGLRGLRADELPKAGIVLRQHWLSIIPLAILVYLILTGKTHRLRQIYYFAGSTVGTPLRKIRHMEILDCNNPRILVT